MNTVMDQKILEKIIEAGNMAPSGSNSQPWRFVVKNGAIEIIALPEKDHKVLNFRKRGTYLAHGALIENMEIASRHFGLEPRFEMFPREGVFAKATFRPGHQVPETDLYEDIVRRHSNRKPYKVQPIADADKRFLLEEAHKFPTCELAFAEGPAIHPIAENLPIDVMISLQNQLLHKLLFEEILWKEEDQKVRHGLYVKTMEVTSLKAAVFKLLRNWRTAQFFAKIKVPQKVYSENVKTASASGLLGAIAVTDSDTDFITAGRLLENIWVRAARLNLSVQLVTGVLFLWQQANLGDGGIFSPAERNIVDRAYEKVRDAFGTKNRIIAVVFRMGHAAPPTAVSYKRPPVIQWG